MTTNAHPEAAEALADLLMDEDIWRHGTESAAQEITSSDWYAEQIAAAQAAALAPVIKVLTDWGVLGTDPDSTGTDFDADFAEAIGESGAWRLARDLRGALDLARPTTACSTCGGTGLVDWAPSQIRYTGEDQQACPDCPNQTSEKGADRG